MNVTCNIFINSFGSVTETTMVRSLPIPCFHPSVNERSPPDIKPFLSLLSSPCFVVMAKAMGCPKLVTGRYLSPAWGFSGQRQTSLRNRWSSTGGNSVQSTDFGIRQTCVQILTLPSNSFVTGCLNMSLFLFPHLSNGDLNSTFFTVLA